MAEKTDLRVIKTKKALVETMMESLGKKRFEDITVQDLCDKAMVRRATFYTHFADKYELLGYSVRSQYVKFPSYAQFETASNTEDIYRYLVKDAVDFLADNLDIFRSVVNSQATQIILNTIRNEMEQDFLPLIEESMRTNDIHGLSPQFIFNFYLHGIFGSFLWWMREDYPLTKEELVLQIQSMLHIK